ncbi:unnamed protein product [Effrenium voratum]|nr:unnamed protein product [Effrenium voratum]
MLSLLAVPALVLGLGLALRRVAQAALRARYHENRSFVFENWFAGVEKVTFPTKSVPLDAEDVEALARASDDALALIPGRKVRPCDGLRLERLARAVQKALEELSDAELDEAGAAAPGLGAFVRLNYLSPKDAVLDNLEQLGAAQKWPQVLAQARQELPKASEETQRATAALRLLLALTRVASGEEALWMLTHSHRTFEDFWLRRLRIDAHCLRGTVDRIQVRRWEAELLPEAELRGFVFQKKLTALSQYHCSVLVPRFVEDPVGTLGLVVDFFGGIRDKLPEVCVVDFAFLRGGGLRVIECNPFGPVTGSLLFDWHKDALVLAGWWPSRHPIFRYVRSEKELGGQGQVPLAQVLEKLDLLAKADRTEPTELVPRILENVSANLTRERSPQTQEEVATTTITLSATTAVATIATNGSSSSSTTTTTIRPPGRRLSAAALRVLCHLGDAEGGLDRLLLIFLVVHQVCRGCFQRQPPPAPAEAQAPEALGEDASVKEDGGLLRVEERRFKLPRAAASARFERSASRRRTVPRGHSSSSSALETFKLEKAAERPGERAERAVVSSGEERGARKELDLGSASPFGNSDSHSSSEREEALHSSVAALPRLKVPKRKPMKRYSSAARRHPVHQARRETGNTNSPLAGPTESQ